MLRLIGGICVFCAAAYGGFYLADRLKKRRDFLRAMSQSLSFVLSEIQFAHNGLADIFGRADISKALCGFFDNCRAAIPDKGIRAAWQAAIDKAAETAALKAEDIEAITQLGQSIGMSDVGGQKKVIERTISVVDKYTQLAEADYERLAKPYRGCGVLLGVFFLIIII